MKTLALLLTMLCSFFFMGYAQYFPGARNPGANEIPGFLAQLKNSSAAQKKTDILLNLGFGYLLKIGAEKADMDSAMFYAQQAMALSKQIDHTNFLNQALLLKAITFLEKRELGAAKRLLHEVNDTSRAQLLFCISKQYFYGEQSATNNSAHIDSSVHYAHLAVQLASHVKHTALHLALIHWLDSKGRDYMGLNLYEKAINEYLFILQYYIPTNTYLSRIYALTGVCNLTLRSGDFHKSLSYALQAEKELKESDADVDHYNVYSNLGNIYKMQDNHEKALLYFGKLSNDPVRYAPFTDIYILAQSYCHALRFLKRNEETIPYMEKLQQKYPAKNDLNKSFYHLNLSNAYREMDKFDLAEDHMLKAIHFLELSKSPTATFYAYLGTLYDKFNYPEKAIIALRTADQKFTKEADLIKASTYRFIAKTEATLGNHEVAYNYLLKSKTITDSVYVASKEKHTQELEFQYQTQKKEADLRLKEENIRYLHQQALLMEQDGKLQKAKLSEASLLAGQKEAILQLREKDIDLLNNSSKQQQAEIEQAEAKRKITALVMKITILVIILLAVIIALLCWLFWSKLRSNKIITHKNGQLQQLLTDKSWLLKEMHHRVKNNLHTVISLLESQSAYLQDDALEAVKNSQSRIYSMSLIHQKLYQSDDIRTIDMAYYIPELITYLRESFSLGSNFHINMELEHTALNVTEAVPLGLIVNEVVTNSMKYAFKNKQHGEINISMKATSPNYYELIIADNGIGLSKGFDIDNITSLGFRLIKGLSRQLEAQLHITNEKGLRITLSDISIYNTIKFGMMESELHQQLTA